jgi:2-oxoisovalerate dehydrogenase E1 component alpha subunit
MQIEERSAVTTAAAPSASPKLDLRRAYRLMCLTRALDERIWSLSQQGRVGISGPVRGHEATQVASALALRPGLDVVFPYYRDIGVALTLGLSPLDILLGALDRGTDPFSGARQMPFHFTSPRLRIPSPSTSIATQIPHAVGAALASRLRGEDAVTIVYFGDGAASKADFHEGMSFAAIHGLPIVFFCENNQYAISVPLELQMPVSAVAERAAAYDVPSARVDGNDVEETFRATLAAVERARAGGGPTLLEALVYRLGPHTSHDDDTRYRSREEVARWEARDPIERLRSTLLERGALAVGDDETIWAELQREIDAALAAAEAAPLPDRAAAFAEILSAHHVPDPFVRSGELRQDDTLGIHATGTTPPTLGSSR